MPRFFVFLILLSSLSTSAQQNSSYHFKYKKGKYYLINPKGKKVKCKPFSSVVNYSEGMAVVSNSLEFTYIDSTGQQVIDQEYYDAGPFIEGMAYAAIDEKYGFINREGDFVIEPQYLLASNFSDGLAYVQVNNYDAFTYGETPYLNGLISKDGNLLGDEYYTNLFKSIDGEYYNAVKKDSLFHLSIDGQRQFISLVGDSIFHNVDNMPEFPGGEIGLRKFIARTVRYPVRAQENSIQGRCYITFIVNEEGNVVDYRPAIPVSPVLIKESLRVVSRMPKWKPGGHKGKPIRLSYTVPVTFVLQ